MLFRSNPGWAQLVLLLCVTLTRGHLGHSARAGLGWWVPDRVTHMPGLGYGRRVSTISDKVELRLASKVQLLGGEPAVMVTALNWIPP